MLITDVFQTRGSKVIAAVVAVLLLAVFQVALQAKPAKAWEVRITITGAGQVTETTPANLVGSNCFSPNTTPTGTTGKTCLAGTPTGPYGSAWDVDYVATPASGYTFKRWEPDGTTRQAIICNRSDPPATTTTYTGSVCKFTTWENLQTRAVFEDDTDPTMASLTGPNSTVGGSTSFTFSATTDPTFSHFECRVVGVHDWQTCTSPKSENPTTSGSYTFDVRAVDRSGNRSTISSWNWTVDKTAPTASINFGPPALVNNNSSTFGFSASEAATFQCRLDSATFASCTGSTSQSYSNLPDGSRTFYVRAIDSVGNIGNPTSHTWTIDTAPPNTTLDPNVGPTPDSATQNNDPVFAFTSRENDSTFECNLTGPGMTDTAFTACNTSPNTQITKSYTNLPDGTYTFKVRAKDQATNVDTDYSDSTRTWTIDTLPPAAPVINSPTDNFLSNSNDITVSGTAEANSEVEVFDGGNAEDTTTADGSGNWSITLPDEAEGSHTYTAKATDGVGLTSGVSNARSVTVDTIAPDGTVVINNNAAATNNAAVNLTLNATDPDPGSGVTHMRFSNDGVTWSAWKAYATSFSWNLIGGEGTKTVRVQFRDAASNRTSPPASDTIKLDTTAPTATGKPTGTGISPTANVIAVFSEAMNEASVEKTNASGLPTTFTLKKKGTTRTLAATVVYSQPTATTFKAVLNPSSNLRAGTTYIAKLTSAATDVAGNPLVVKTWTFRVKP